MMHPNYDSSVLEAACNTAVAVDIAASMVTAGLGQGPHRAGLDLTTHHLEHKHLKWDTWAIVLESGHDIGLVDTARCCRTAKDEGQLVDLVDAVPSSHIVKDVSQPMGLDSAVVDSLCIVGVEKAYSERLRY
jgi:hypothetical protein